jgi:glutamate dehydrogenase/leucine dehydrogenase
LRQPVPDLRARVAAGAANNPLGGPELAGTLASAGVLYVPDYLANCGGIIHVGAEVLGLDDAGVDDLIQRSIAQTASLLRESLTTGQLPSDLAIALAQARLAAADPGGMLEHQMILEALLSGHVSSAEELITAHLLFYRDRLLESFGNDDDAVRQ